MPRVRAGAFSNSCAPRAGVGACPGSERGPFRILVRPGSEWPAPTRSGGRDFGADSAEFGTERLDLRQDALQDADVAPATAQVADLFLYSY